LPLRSATVSPAAMGSVLGWPACCTKNCS
jgi:hypothetical protein